MEQIDGFFKFCKDGHFAEQVVEKIQVNRKEWGSFVNLESFLCLHPRIAIETVPDQYAERKCQKNIHI
jgi:hypothetical protein